MIEIVIENVGNGTARNVRFRTSEKLPARFLTSEGGKFMEYGPLIDGIPALGPRQKRAILWDNHPELLHHFGTRQVRVTVKWDRANGEEAESECILEVASLTHVELRFDDGMWACAEELRAMNERTLPALSPSRPGSPMA